MVGAQVQARLAAAGGTPCLLFTTNPGLEDIVAEEYAHRAAALGVTPVEAVRRPFGFGGHTLVYLPEASPAAREAALALRSVHHVVRPLYAFELADGSPAALVTIADHLRRRGVPDLEGGPSFRVTTHRNGDHAFTSLDVQRAAGAALVERYAGRVDLTGHDVEVRVDVIERTCIVGVQLTRQALSRRHLRPYSPRAALKANVAYALLHLARLEPGSGPLLDPFCGSGTILLEAAALFPDLEIEGGDLDPEAVAGTRLNLATAGLEHRVRLWCADASQLSETHPPGRFSAIVTNPPYGVRLGRNLDFHAFYRRLLEQAAVVLRPGGRLVLIAWKRGVVDRLNRELGLFTSRHVRVVETGGIYPRVYVLERR
ncbi:MAG: THUMP domain-containing protein [Gemmatimonadota bacterium]